VETIQALQMDAVSKISKIGLSAVLHVKIGVVKSDVNGRAVHI